MTDPARAYTARFWEGYRHRMDAATMQAAARALAVNPRPLMVAHKGHDTGLRVRVAVRLFTDSDGMDAPELVCQTRRRGGGVVDGPSWECGECGAVVGMSDKRLVPAAVAALIARAGGKSGRPTRINLT